MNLSRLFFTTILFSLIALNTHAQEGLFDSKYDEAEVNEDEKRKKKIPIDADGSYIYFGYSWPVNTLGDLQSYGTMDLGYHKAFWGTKKKIFHIGMDFGYLQLAAYNTSNELNIDNINGQVKASFGPYLAVTKNKFSIYTTYKAGYGILVGKNQFSRGFSHDASLGLVARKFSIKATYDMQTLKEDGFKYNLDAIKLAIGFRM